MCRDESRTRPLTAAEAGLLKKLFSGDFRGATELDCQLEGILASELDSNGSLQLYPQNKVPADVAWRIAAEASYVDPDDITVHILVHVIDGFLDEMEVYREDLGAVLTRPTQADPLEIQRWD